MKKQTKKKLIIGLSIGIASTIILVPASIAITALIYSNTYDIPEQKDTIINTTGLVQVKDRSLYDKNGKKIRLEGVNFGNVFLQEGWLGPFALEPNKNPDGTYVRDHDNHFTYPEFTEEDFRNGLLTNPNCGETNFNTWFDYYFNSWINDVDYKIIKEELNLNCIRLPIYWKNLLNDDLTRKDENEAFYYIDKIIESAKANDLYIILDLHGVPGSQNGYEHSGTTEFGASFWHNEEYINSALDCWDFISNHYLTTRSDLSSTIASYDLLNEPTYETAGSTEKFCWDVFDKMYDVIRNNNDNHVITIEGCWTFANLPNPKDYNWENVQYEYHWYNFNHEETPYWLFYAVTDFWNIGKDYNVPVFIGEFTFFEDAEQWQYGLDLFKEREYSWTTWNYKACTVGWWSTSWGVLSAKLNFDTSKDEKKIDVSKCTFEEFKNTCDKLKSEHCEKYTLYNVLKNRNN